MSKHTRLVVTVALLLIVCPALLAGEGWRNKPPQQWTEDDARLVLFDSPWAQRATVKHLGTAAGRSGGMGRIPNPLPGGGAPPMGGPPIPGGGDPGGARSLSEITVRWQSASAVRLAFAKIGVQSPPGLERAQDSYVIAAMGIPEMGPESIDPDDSTTLGRLRDGARLLVGKNRSVIPSRVRASRNDQGLTLFFIFPKKDLGPLTDEKLKLIARVGPAQLSVEFKAKDMKLAGTPDL